MGEKGYTMIFWNLRDAPKQTIIYLGMQGIEINSFKQPSNEETIFFVTTTPEKIEKIKELQFVKNYSGEIKEMRGF